MVSRCAYGWKIKSDYAIGIHRIGSLSFEEIKLNPLESLYQTMEEFYDYNYSEGKCKRIKENRMWVDIIKEGDSIEFIINDNIVEVEKDSLFFDDRNILIVNFMQSLSQDIDIYSLHMQLIDAVKKQHENLPDKAWAFHSFIVRPDGQEYLNVLDTVFNFMFRNAMYTFNNEVRSAYKTILYRMQLNLDRDSAFMGNMIDKRISKFIISNEVTIFDIYKINMGLKERVEVLNKNLGPNEKEYDWLSIMITPKPRECEFVVDTILRFLLRNLYRHFEKSKSKVMSWMSTKLRQYSEQYYIEILKPQIFTERMLWEMGNRKNIMEEGNSNHEIITHEQLRSLVDVEIEKEKEKFQEKWKKW